MAGVVGRGLTKGLLPGVDGTGELWEAQILDVQSGFVRCLTPTEVAATLSALSNTRSQNSVSAASSTFGQENV